MSGSVQHVEEPEEASSKAQANGEQKKEEPANGSQQVKATQNGNHDEEPDAKKRKKVDNGKFRYGNFNQYYGMRTKGLDMDPRLELIPRDWIRRKRVLDIGCNAGYLTITLAKEFQPQWIVGIDIDPELVGIARKNIRHYCDKGTPLVGKLPATLADKPASDKFPEFPCNLWFQRENYVLENDDLLELVNEEYDIILALSITKWIHLNWGDVGMKRFFRRVHRHLRPGGRLILEPQAYTTYYKRAKQTEETRENYRNIKFKPEEFKDYLLSEDVGFERSEELGVPKAKSKGFERPLQVFHKATRTPPHEKGTKSKASKLANGSTSAEKMDTADASK